MKIFKIIFFAAMIIATFTACNKDRVKGSGPVINETRNLTNFTKIRSSGSTDVFITQGTDFKVEVNGYSNLIPYFDTRVINGTLETGYRNNVNVKNDNIKVYVTLPVLTGLSIAGSGDISTSGTFNNNPVFEANISGSGNIHFSQGTAQLYQSNIAGSGNIFAFGMLADHAEINISGSGNHEISASTQLKVNIAGSGNVYYKNTPIVTAQVSGSGAVIHR